MGALLDKMKAGCSGPGRLHKIGEFEVRSGTLFISDPGYELDRENLDGQEIVERAGDGIWSFYNFRDGYEVLKAFAVLKDFEHESAVFTDQEVPRLLVDSGQIGIFDVELYRKDGQFSEEFVPLCCYSERKKGWIFYGACCDCTLSREHAGVIPSGGVTKCKGGDDGIYSGRIYRYKDQAVAVMLEFTNH